MDSAWLARARWRWRGAWMWPTFVVCAALDGILAHAWPVSGDSASFYSGLLVGLVLNLLAVVAVSRPLGSLLRRLRTDLPVEIARNYAGTVAVVAVSAAILVLGLLNHSSVVARRHALDDAIARAEAFIGDRAPAEFRANAYHTDTFTIQAGLLYRTCVVGRQDGRSYCVIVHERMPLAQSVTPDGYEPNAVFAEGVN
jgi:hypothetical protein